ncbi:hypothetical protein Pmani_002344 [Petrolisthes manimaculis]|uniref:DZIP3-like HEPN domain-containing protein n=1 Tax=Petrolisthes manimaculis TaxID=1843537 RepID=A0AAE1QHR1_9EUCA|nr:hypothetical protein Pmani_002344 [Petrolisthes manimaculis]
MCRVFLYLYEHHQPDPNVYVGQRLREIPNGWARIGRIEKEMLMNQRVSPYEMDICLLYTLLQRTCGLQPDTQNDSVWNTPTSPDGIERQLYLLKERRNHLVHNANAYLNLTKQELIEKVNVLERRVWKSWVSSYMTDNTEYDLMVKVECGQVTTRDVGRLVKEELLPQASQDCDPSQVVKLLTSL